MSYHENFNGPGLYRVEIEGVHGIWSGLVACRSAEDIDATIADYVDKFGPRAVLITYDGPLMSTPYSPEADWF